ncbi:hypothetical protein GCM10018775_30860 [Streptomyces umbrinus]|nr:hypothetical protein GCM10018775_30860 [Streptomyces umbrinus]
METSGITGGWNVTCAATSRKAASIGSISGEWKACETRSRRDRSKRAATSATAVSSPEMTTASGPLTAAIATRR